MGRGCGVWGGGGEEREIFFRVAEKEGEGEGLRRLKEL